VKSGYDNLDGPVAAYLITEQGGPGPSGRCTPLSKGSLLVGRPTASFTPDIGLDNFLISRSHCRLELLGDAWTIVDLGSKHGTTLNDQPLTAHAAHPLKAGDKIGLAAGAALFRFVIPDENEKTLEFDQTRPGKLPVALPPLVVDLAKMKLVVDDKTIALSAKEWLLLELLYRHRSRFVSYDEIRAAVWAERYAADSALPEVGVEEINVLTYRLRRKLGACGSLIKTRRGRGCILEYQ
jgi:DNA-binding winged helix-turn-helix (wHTH) protein